MDEAHKCQVLESDGKIADRDIPQAAGAALAKSFGQGGGFCCQALG
jgi:hypothetical protein